MVGLAVAALVSCGQGSSEEGDVKTPARAVQIVDIKGGSYRDVRLGTGRTELFAEFGESAPIAIDEPATTLANPEGSDGAPVVILDRPFDIYRYQHVVAMFSDRRLRVLLIDDPEAATAEDVAIGDPLDQVKEVYGSPTCGLAQENTEYEPYPACYLKLSPDRHVWFGGDPIRSIEIAEMRIGDLPPK